MSLQDIKNSIRNVPVFKTLFFYQKFCSYICGTNCVFKEHGHIGHISYCQT